jgi:hypothetical protein
LTNTANNICATFARARALVLNQATGKIRFIWESHWLRNIYDRTRRRSSDMSRSLTMPHASYDAAWTPTWRIMVISMIAIAIRILICKVYQGEQAYGNRTWRSASGYQTSSRSDYRLSTDIDVCDRVWPVQMPSIGGRCSYGPHRRRARYVWAVSVRWRVHTPTK